MTFTTFTHGSVWLILTLACYCIAVAVAKKARFNPLLHPITVTVALLSVFVIFSDTSVTEFQSSTYVIHWLLGPATVALAVPIHSQWMRIQRLGVNTWFSIAIGGIIAPLLAWLTLYLYSAPTAVQLTMILKSVSTPFAMAAADAIGGIGELAAVFVIITGIVGAMVSEMVFRCVNVTDARAQGLALGTVAHAVGTSKAVLMGEEAAAMAVVALCINGIVTALVLPFLFSLNIGV